MRDKIQKIVVQAIAGTKDITEAIDELLLLCSVSGSTLGTMDANCDHDIDKLYNKNGDYKGDYCKKCKGVYQYCH